MNVVMPPAELPRPLLADAASAQLEHGTPRPAPPAAPLPAVPSAEEGARLVAHLDAAQVGKAAEWRT